jgi:hypothetical protein
MPVDWRNQGFNPNLLANRLEQIKRVDQATRQVTFRGFEAEEVVTVLHSALKDFAERIPETVQRKIVADAAFARALDGRITGPALLREIQNREDKYTQLPLERYVLSTSLSVRHFSSLTSTEISGHRITFNPLPNRFRHAYEEAKSRAEDQIVGPLPDHGPSWKRYIDVRISVWGRSQEEAAERAWDALDLLRGIWNYSLNFTRGMRSSGGRRKPVNRLVLGPLHSLHHPTGKLAEAGPWVDSDYAGPLRPYNLSKDWANLKPFADQVRSALAGGPYREELEGAVRRYVRALDRRDWNASFLQLWGVLETLTNTSRERYEVTVNRTLFLTRPDRRDFDRQILMHLIDYRNKTVHAGHETQAIETLLFQLKRYVERCLGFHLWFRPRFGSIPEVARFLDLPPEQEKLRESVQLLRRALSLQERLQSGA